MKVSRSDRIAFLFSAALFFQTYRSIAIPATEAPGIIPYAHCSKVAGLCPASGSVAFAGLVKHAANRRESARGCKSISALLEHTGRRTQSTQARKLADAIAPARRYL